MHIDFNTYIYIYIYIKKGDIITAALSISSLLTWIYQNPRKKRVACKVSFSKDSLQESGECISGEPLLWETRACVQENLPLSGHPVKDLCFPLKN